MPYKDIDKQRAKDRAYRKKLWAENPQKCLEFQRKYRRQTGRASLCTFPGCAHFRVTHLYCDAHTLKNLIGDHRMYDRVRNHLRKALGKSKIKDVPREIFLVLLILDKSKYELLKTKKAGGLTMDITLVKKGISNPAMQELVGAILQTVEEVRSGKKTHNQGLTELSGYKQVVQIMALEVMRHRLPVSGFIASKSN